MKNDIPKSITHKKLRKEYESCDNSNNINS